MGHLALCFPMHTMPQTLSSEVTRSLGAFSSLFNRERINVKEGRGCQLVPARPPRSAAAPPASPQYRQLFGGVSFEKKEASVKH